MKSNLPSKKPKISEVSKWIEKMRVKYEISVDDKLATDNYALLNFSNSIVPNIIIKKTKEKKNYVFVAKICPMPKVGWNKISNLKKLLNFFSFLDKIDEDLRFVKLRRRNGYITLESSVPHYLYTEETFFTITSLISKYMMTVQPKILKEVKRVFV